ncbi:sugar ABC transporter ATP-binding protein [Fundicoccus culcitae]|uniref:Sugar ABC transporter ATP-binding protein n=1 Tax=Fundicoccus culcitae TaxID=2969821 RepID=A0ABY5P4S8_9LACT|nr:sugar ABC transporter ATP-binding protein [Fundicoccus culcitae]UUX33761.1 sugar ABC transporter ATP-binding protein [Fundicoccus culcitae]
MLLEMKQISKEFPGVKALSNVDFNLQKGEVHALMGENGAGKSTLMKILTGIYDKTSGEVFIDDKLVEFSNTREAQEAGVVMVHQELNNAKDLTVSANIFLGNEPKKGLFIDDKKMIEDSKKLFQQLGVNIDPEIKIDKLTVGDAQMVEIAKAISMEARIIVFDEPTAALSQKETEKLFETINLLKEDGVGIIYISHRMEEIGIISDRVTVLRDGEYVGTLTTKETSRNQIIKMMVGRELVEEVKTESKVSKEAPIILEVKNLNADPIVKNINFTLRRGEILGFSGLMGAGRTETARAIIGADPKQSGDILINGNEVKINNTSDAAKYKIGYISEDRRRYGVLLEKTIAENISLNNLDQFVKYGLIDDKKTIEVADKYRKALNIRSTSATQKVKNLSGGNQQKVVIAKWILKDCDILIFDEPTRGIDVGAKSEIYDLINYYADEGKAIIMISSEMNEILRLSDRIIVFCEGEITADIPIEEATQEIIMDYATLKTS